MYTNTHIHIMIFLTFPVSTMGLYTYVHMYVYTHIYTSYIYVCIMLFFIFLKTIICLSSNHVYVHLGAHLICCSILLYSTPLHVATTFCLFTLLPGMDTIDGRCELNLKLFLSPSINLNFTEYI